MLAWSTSYPARALRAFRGLDAEQRRIALASTVALPVLHVAARLGGLRWVRRVLWLRGGPRGAAIDVATGRRLAQPIAAVAHRLRLDRRGCVARATFLWWVLQRRGVAAEVVIGSRRVEGEFEAHAWVEVGGEPVDDAADVRERFAAFEGRASVMRTPGGAAR
jgi:hypothetical protein